MRQIGVLAKGLSIACLAAIVALGTVAPVQAEAEQGPKVSALLDVVKDGEDVRRRRHHIQQLVNGLGDEVEQAVPALIDLLIAPESHARAGAALSLGFVGPGATRGMLGLIALLEDEAWQVRYAAATALGLLGPSARSSVPLLILVLADPTDNVGYAAGLALVKIDENLPAATASDLIAQMHDENPDVRLSAIVSLARLGNGLTAYRSQLGEPLHDIAGAELVVALRDGDEAERAAAATALKQIAKHLTFGFTKNFKPRSVPKATVLALTDALTDEAAVVRSAAADALSEVGVSVDGVVPALIRTLSDPDPEVRTGAAKGLDRLGWLQTEKTPGIQDAILPLMELRQDSNWRVRAAAALALGRMRLLHQGIVPALVQALQDEDAGVRRAAAVGFFNIGRHVQYIHGPPYELPPEHLQNQRRAEARRAMPALIRALADSDRDVRRWVARTLYELGPTADAVPALLDALWDEFANVRMLAASALGKAQPTTDPIVVALIDALNDDSSSVRQAAASALGRIGPAAKAAVPAVTALLADDNDRVRTAAGRALELIGTR